MLQKKYQNKVTFVKEKKIINEFMHEFSFIFVVVVVVVEFKIEILLHSYRE